MVRESQEVAEPAGYKRVDLQAGPKEGGSVKGGWAGRIIAWHCGSERAKSK